eukprot:gene16192-20691_t
MDEAEALCKRIGIMTHGQLRALGTKQHLKNKFGSGFELVVKVFVTNFDKQLLEMTSFVNSLFPSATLLSENGGLITFQIPREEMKMGVAFSQLEGNKERLQIEDYSIAQPTLEQVFIRTVNKYDVEGAKVAMTEGESAAPEEVFVEVNKCGCTNRTTTIMASVACALFIALILISIFVFGRSN